MIYRRQFEIACAHFNGADTYVLHEAAIFSAQSGDHRSAYKLLSEAMEKMHGHNFRIEVEVHGNHPPLDKEWLIEDELLEATVMEWDRKNLSLLPALTRDGGRVTTERMARVLCDAIVGIIEQGPTAQRIEYVTVRVHETATQVAEYTGYLGLRLTVNGPEDFSHRK